MTHDETGDAAGDATGRGFDEAAFLAIAATEDADIAACFRRLFAGARRSGMQIDRAAVAGATAVGWCEIGGAPSITWVATAGGEEGSRRTACLEVWLSDILARAATPPFAEIALAFLGIPLVAAGKAGHVLIAAQDLVSHPDQATRLFAAFDRLVAAGRALPPPSDAGGALYEWGERGERGG